MADQNHPANGFPTDNQNHPAMRTLVAYIHDWLYTPFTHLAKLDRVQKSAERIGGFKIESLGSRREAVAVSLALDLLDGKGYGELQQHM